MIVPLDAHTTSGSSIGMLLHCSPCQANTRSVTPHSPTERTVHAPSDGHGAPSDGQEGHPRTHFSNTGMQTLRWHNPQCSKHDRGPPTCPRAHKQDLQLQIPHHHWPSSACACGPLAAPLLPVPPAPSCGPPSASAPPPSHLALLCPPPGPRMCMNVY